MTEAAPSAGKSVDTALLLALASAVAYGISMSFECGYAAYFGVEAKLVEANPKNILICAATVIFSIPGGLYAWNQLGMMWPRSWHPAIRRAVGSVLVVPCLIAVTYYLFGLNLWSLALLALPYFFLLVLSELVFPLLGFRDKPTFAAKLEAERERAANELKKSPTLIMSLEEKYGWKPVWYLIVVLVACGLAFGFGFRDARTQSSFLVISGKEPCVFVTSYMDSLICAGFDAPTKKLSGHLRFIQAHDPSTDFELRTLGRLSAADENSWAPVPRPKPVPKPTGTASPVQHSVPSAPQTTIQIN